MKLVVNIKHLRTLQQVADFVHGSGAMEPVATSQAQRYQGIKETLRHFCYERLAKADKGLIVAYLGCVTDYFRQQLTRLIRCYRETGRLHWIGTPGQWLQPPL